jgi:hypothetical protein
MPERRSPPDKICFLCGAKLDPSAHGVRVVLPSIYLEWIEELALEKAKQQRRRGYKVHYDSELTLEEMYALGWAGETAVRCFLGYEWQPISIGRADSGFDVTHHGWNFQVKTTRKIGTGFYCQTAQWKSFQHVDGAILVWRENDQGLRERSTYWLAGWGWLKELRSCAVKEVLPKQRLSSWLIRWPCFTRHTMEELKTLAKKYRGRTHPKRSSGAADSVPRDRATGGRLRDRQKRGR